VQVRLIGKANGVGLSRDFELLSAALRACGCEVTLRPCERPDRKRRRGLITRLAARARVLHAERGGRRRPAAFAANLMLEHVWPQFLHEADCNVLVPNPEWFDRRDLAFLGATHRVWAKTAMAERLFAVRGCRTVLIGFDSSDRQRPGIARQPRFLHLAGRSPLKGTARLMALWLRHPEWPSLTIAQDVEVELAGAEAASRAPNLIVHREFLSDETLLELQNSHRFHICTSEAEGWGHYIAEAMSVGAVTITCDAPPMNELVGAERGVLVAAREGPRHNLATLAQFQVSALEAAIARVLGMSPAQWDAIGAAARQWFLANKGGFESRVQRAVNDLRPRGQP
jgi:glycosyltransferase involved in cell wall biosynthesis